jgi:hypothetical protein
MTKFNKGDKVRIIDTTIFNKKFVKAGQVATVENVIYDGEVSDYTLSHPDWDLEQYTMGDDVELVTDENS